MTRAHLRDCAGLTVQIARLMRVRPVPDAYPFDDPARDDWQPDTVEILAVEPDTPTRCAVTYRRAGEVYHGADHPGRLVETVKPDWQLTLWSLPCPTPA